MNDFELTMSNLYMLNTSITHMEKQVPVLLLHFAHNQTETAHL